jgi:putative hydrolase of HD superfamily
MKKSHISRDLDFLFEIGTLRRVPRGWQQHLSHDVATVPEHSFRVMYLALIIAQMEGFADEALVMKMALLHDVAETRVSDLSYVQKVYVEANEHAAATDLFAGTSLEHMQETLVAYEARKERAAQIVKDADNLDVDLELREFEDLGHKLPKKWLTNRTMVRDEKLYTESAKQLWDAIQTADPDNWHLTTNKWKRIPQAGK